MNTRVKGTILIDFVKTIKADKTAACAKHLTPADLAVIQERLLPSGWYPFDTFKRCFLAVFEVLAKADLERARQWGRLYGENIIKGTYRGMIREGDPMGTLQKYGNQLRNFFDGGAIEVEPTGDKSAMVKIRDFDRDFAAIYYIMAGWIERSLEMSGAKEVKSVFLEKSWEGKAATKLSLSWK